MRAPLSFVLYWNYFTLLLFLISPYDWNASVGEICILIAYLLVNLLFLKFGYEFGLNTSINNVKLRSSGAWNKFNQIRQSYSLRTFKLFLVIKVLWSIPGYNLKLGLPYFDFLGFFSRVSIGFLSLGESYNLRHTEELIGLDLSVQLFSSFLNTLSFLVLPLAVLLWKELGIFIKTVVVVLFLLDIIYWVGIGTNVGIMNMIVAIYCMRLVSGVFDSGVKKRKIMFPLVLLFFGLFFASSILDRFKVNYGTTEVLFLNRIGGSQIDFDNVLFDFLPNSFMDAMIIASNYLNQGYFHLLMSFEYPFEWTYGLGNNYTTIGLSDKFTNQNILSMTYAGKLESVGVDSYNHWHSAYMWYANDVSFFGVPIIMFLHGMFMARLWRVVIFRKNVFAVGLFLLTIYQGIYLSANNHVLSFSFFNFLFLLIMFNIQTLFARERF